MEETISRKHLSWTECEFPDSSSPTLFCSSSLPTTGDDAVVVPSIQTELDNGITACFNLQDHPGLFWVDGQLASTTSPLCRFATTPEGDCVSSAYI